MRIKTDVLVIGSGIAGLRFAIEVSKFAEVYIVTKKDKAESNTNYAQGGIASVFSPDDSFELHIQDTLKTGDGLCNREAVELIVREGPVEIQKLIELGTKFSTRDNGSLDLAREGGHSKNRIVHAKDLTGREIEKALLNRISQIENIHLLENHFAIDLITEHHLPNKKTHDKIHCWGAYVYDVQKEEVHTFLAKVTLLATGGLGQAYLHTTNPSIATGDGFAMAYRAGALMANMEFIQFHPTALYEGNLLERSASPAFLISEAVRGFGAKLRLKNGEEFMHKYDPRGELAPRDIVARAIDNELKKRGEDFVYLDLTHKNPDEIKERFPNIYQKCLEKKIDITKDFIPVIPAAHYACGGVVTDLNGQTSIINLFATGEVAMTGVHGANRLASNSLLEALVFSKYAALSCKKILRENVISLPEEIPDWIDTSQLSQEEKILIAQTRHEIREILWDYVGIVRSNERLSRALKRCNLINEEVKMMYNVSKISEEILELRNLSIVAFLITYSASLRKESRGLHYNIDHPNKDDINFLKPTFVQNPSP
ncbi:MAG: L-aspartate oxidase [Ignavibacteria bacterium]|nr:L-aspartate oxidase [Ignavibacteria bacterium]